MQNSVSLFALKEAKKCSKGFALSKLHLNYHGGAVSASKVVKDAVNALKEPFVKNGSLEEALASVKIVLVEYPVGPDDLASAAEQAREKAYRRIEEMAKYLWAQEGVRRADVPLSFEADGVSFFDRADFGFEIGGNVARVVKVENEENPFSTRARNPENHPSRSLQNAFMRAAGYAAVETWYLRSKDEKGDVVPPFEVKPEKNVAVGVISEEEAKSYLSGIMKNATECGDCKNCRHASVCQIREVRIDAEKSIGSKKDPVFTEEQKKAVEHQNGAMALLAVPGAGKTTVLVHRLLKLLKSGVSASEILFVTFTKKAAGEIRERVEALLPEDADIPEISTFNALGYNILKENPMLVGKRIKVADENDLKKLAREVIELFARNGRYLAGMSYAGAYLKFGIVSRLAGWFREIAEVGKETFVERRGAKISDLDGVLAMYDEYEKMFKSEGYITFDEQVSLVNEIFGKYPKVSAQYAERYRYIMVDEFQDSSEEQVNMIYSIAKHHGNIVVVGDEDQSIYGWRGGSNRFLLNFREDFPNAEIVVMSDNFRSNDKILAAADSVIRINKTRVAKELRGHKEVKNPPLFFRNCGVEKIAEVIPQLLRAYRPGDIAILAKTNDELGEIEEALDGIVKMSAPKDYLVNDAVFQIMYDVLTLYYNLKDDAALYRLLVRLGVSDFPEKENSAVALYDVLHENDPRFNLDRIDIDAMKGYAEADTQLLKAGRVILSLLKKLQYYRSMEVAFTAIADAFQIPFDHKVFANLLDTCDEHAIVKVCKRLHERKGLQTIRTKYVGV